MGRPPRPPRESIFAHGMWQHMVGVGLLLGAVLVAFALQMAVLYLPFLNGIFRTQSLSLGERVLCLGLSGTVFLAPGTAVLYLNRACLISRTGRSNQVR